MENILQSLMSSKLFVIIVILIAAILVYAILKRLLKMIIFMLIALTLYVGYMVYTGQELPSSPIEAIRQGENKINDFRKEGEKIIDTIKIINEARDKIDQSNSSASE